MWGSDLPNCQGSISEYWFIHAFTNSTSTIKGSIYGIYIGFSSNATRYGFCFCCGWQVLEGGMAISTWFAGTRHGLTLMGWILPDMIKNKVGFGFWKKKTRIGSRFLQTPGSNPGSTWPGYIRNRKSLKYPLIYIVITDPNLNHFIFPHLAAPLSLSLSLSLSLKLSNLNLSSTFFSLKLSRPR